MIEKIEQIAAWRLALDDGDNVKPELEKLVSQWKDVEKAMDSALEWAAGNDGGPHGDTDPIYQALVKMDETTKDWLEFFKPNGQ